MGRYPHWSRSIKQDNDWITYAVISPFTFFRSIFMKHSDPFFNEEVERILDMVRSYLKGLSQPLQEMSLRFFHMHKDIPFIRDGILFPYWIAESLCLEDQHEFSRLLGESNVYGFFYVRLNDYIQDGFTHINSSNGILCCLFWNKMVSNYRSLFDHDSPFWLDFDETVLEYCNAKVSECSRHVFKTFDHLTDEMLEFNIIELGKKSGLLKLCSYAYVHLIGPDRELIRAISQILDHYNAGLQLLDDIQDWKQDIERNRINTASAFLIEKLFKSNQITACGELSPDRLAGCASVVDFQEIYQQALDQFERALAQCRDQGFHMLEQHIEKELCEARERMVSEKKAKEKMRKVFYSEKGGLNG